MNTESTEDFFNELSGIHDANYAEVLDNEVLICECFCVNVKDIRQLFEETQEIDLEILRKNYSLGEGCKDCLKNQHFWLNKIF